MATFSRIVEAGSLSAAARSLKLSLPAVSRQLRALEEELGTTLLVRTTRRLSLTERGRSFYESALRISREVEQATERARPSRDARGTLVVSAPVSLALSLVVPRLPALVGAHPRLSVDLRLEDRLVDFVSEGVDVAIRGGAPPPDSTAYVAHPLSRFRRVLVASPAYLRKRGTPRAPEDLLRHACLLQIAASGATRWSLVGGGKAPASVPLDVVGPVRATAPVALLELARAGAGVALLADWMVAADLEAGTLRRVLPAWQSPEVETWAIHRVEQRGSPAVRALLVALGDLGVRPSRKMAPPRAAE